MGVVFLVTPQLRIKQASPICFVAVQKEVKDLIALFEKKKQEFNIVS